jgi:hypothetical protein
MIYSNIDLSIYRSIDIYIYIDRYLYEWNLDRFVYTFDDDLVRLWSFDGTCLGTLHRAGDEAASSSTAPGAADDDPNPWKYRTSVLVEEAHESLQALVSRVMETLEGERHAFDATAYVVPSFRYRYMYVSLSLYRYIYIYISVVGPFAVYVTTTHN